MTLEELKKLCVEILEDCEQSRKSEIVTKITEGFSEILTNSEILTAKVQTLETENSSLREQNMKLYLKVGVFEEKEGEKENEEENEKEELTYEELVDEKGELK